MDCRFNIPQVNRKPTRLPWHPSALLPFLTESLKRLQKRQGALGERSTWWPFYHTAERDLPQAAQDFVAGKYQFSPMTQFTTTEEQVLMWCYRDRLFVRALLFILKPLFKHLISPFVFHLKGPSGVKDAIRLVQHAIVHKKFRYGLRIDIASYYASIQHDILLAQIQSSFEDERLKKYLTSIITILHDEGGELKQPTQGIPRRSALSPFLAALYLSPLDQAFSSQETLYLRFNDDILILTQTQRQYRKAKQKLKKILGSLKLTCSRSKTKMGLLTHFHYLGVQFNLDCAKETETRIQSSQNPVELHNRTCARALARTQLMNASVVHPANIQSYLVKWSRWWSRVASIRRLDNLKQWVAWATPRQPPLVWLGRGLTQL